MSKTNNFYNRFFQIRSSFLSRNSNSLYAKEAYLESIGFSKSSIDWTGLDVCEIGAGLGRLTQSLLEFGWVQSARRYVLVEPSSSIDQLKTSITGDNIAYENADLAAYSSACAGQFDYVLACGVAPHAGEEIGPVVLLLSQLLKPGGTLHLVYSLARQPKRGARLFWEISRKFPFMAAIFAFITTALQYICDRPVLEKFFKLHFFYYFQKTFYANYLQHYEFYAVSPYNVFHTYGDVVEGLSEAGCADLVYYPHALALTARRLPDQGEPAKLAPSGPFAILGDDWLCAWVRRRLASTAEVRCVKAAEEILDTEIAVIAHDHTHGLPYHEVARRLTRSGRVLGTDLFIYQMLI